MPHDQNKFQFIFQSQKKPTEKQIRDSQDHSEKSGIRDVLAEKPQKVRELVWLPSCDGRQETVHAVEFLDHLHGDIRLGFPDVILNCREIDIFQYFLAFLSREEKGRGVSHRHV